MIDAHAGALGVLGPAIAQGGAALDRNLALIAGTSSCLMALSAGPRPVRGRLGAVSRRGRAGAVAERGRAVGHRGVA